MNIIPLLVGTPIFVLPYAFMKAGLCFIPVAVALCAFADVSSNLLVDCLYTTTPTTSPRGTHRRRVHNGLYDVARTCLGEFWANVMSGVVIFYLIANNVINVAVFDVCVRDVVSKVLPMNVFTTTLVYSILFASILFVNKVSVFVVAVFVGMMSLVVATVTSMSVFLYNSDAWTTNLNDIATVNPSEFPEAAAMLMYSLLANPIVPEIEAGMMNPGKVGRTLHISYATSSTFKIVFGLFGALTFGAKTSELIAVNVMGGEGNNVAKYFTLISLILCSYANCSLPNYILFDKLDNVARSHVSPRLTGAGRLSLLWLVLSRIVGVVCMVWFAVALPYYGPLTAVVGGVVGCFVTLVFPVLFHLKLHWHSLCVWRRISELLLLVVGVGVSLVVVYQSILVFAVELFRRHGLIVAKP